jgi:hypothetical protein
MAELEHWGETHRRQQIGHVQGNGTQCHGLNKTTKLRFFLWGT